MTEVEAMPMNVKSEYTKEFKRDLAALLNKHCIPSRSNVPDFILANYLTACLEAFDQANGEGSAWNELPDTQN